MGEPAVEATAGELPVVMPARNAWLAVAELDTESVALDPRCEQVRLWELGAVSFDRAWPTTRVRMSVTPVGPDARTTHRSLAAQHPSRRVTGHSGRAPRAPVP